jgi:hypothetical protein
MHNLLNPALTTRLLSEDRSRPVVSGHVAELLVLEDEKQRDLKYPSRTFVNGLGWSGSEFSRAR